MPKFLKYILTAAVVLVAILLISPWFIPVEGYKNTIISEVKKATGRDLKIEGNIYISFLPTPMVTIHNLSLSSLPQAQTPDFIKLEVAKAALSIWDLFKGKLAISYVDLDHPEIFLEVLKDGTNTWSFTKIASDNEDAVMNQVTESKETDTPLLPIIIERISVIKGKLQYISDGKKHVVEDINLNLNFKDQAGPVNFDANFLNNGQTLYLDGNVQNLKGVSPTTIKLRALGSIATINGDLDFNKISFTGNVEANGSIENLHSTLSKHEFLKELQDDYKLTSDLYFDKDMLLLSSITLAAGSVSGKGDGSFDFKNTTGKLSFSADPGNINFNFAIERSPKGNVESKLDLQIKQIKLLFEALKVDTQYLPAPITQEFSFKAVGNYENNELTLKNIMLSLGNAALRGILAIKTDNQKTNLLYDLKTEDIATFIKLFKINLPVNLADFQVKGETFQDGNNIRTNTTIATAKAVVNIKGDINTDSGIKPIITINATGSSLAQTLGELFQTSIPNGLGKFSFATSIEGDISKSLKVLLKQSTLSIGNESTNLSGNVIVIFEQARPKVISNIEISSINIDGLRGVSQATPTKSHSTLSVEKMPMHWSNKEISLKSFQSLDGNFELSLKKFVKGALIFDNIKGKAHITNGVLNIDSLTGLLFGGQFEGTGTISGQAEQPINLQATLKNANLRNIIPENNKFKVTQGTFNLNADLKSRGKNQYEYINNLSGTLGFNAIEGRVSGVNLQKVLDALANANSLDGVLRVLDASFSEGETAFKSLDGAMLVDHGIAELNNLTLKADKVSATATGKIDLPKYSLDVVSTVFVDIKNMPSFKVRFYGALDNPMHQLDTQALQKHLIDNVLKNVINNIQKGKKPEDIVKDIFGFGSKNDGSSDSSKLPPTEVTPSPSNPLNNLIQKGLGGLMGN